MALVSVNSKPSYGFISSFEIDQTFFSSKKPYTAETKTVDGMPDVKWSIKVYPIDPQLVGNEYFGIYACIESKKEINYKIYGKFNPSEYKVGDTSFYFADVNGRSLGGKFERCIKYEKIHLCMQKYSFANGKLSFQVDAAFSYTRKPKEVPKIYDPVKWGLRLKENSDEDFEIAVDGETFRIHKLVIAAESPVFKQMFDSNFKEARECKVTIIDFDPQIVKAFIDYCYGQCVTTESDTDNINLLSFSDKYDCQTLKPQLEAQIASKISKENISLFVLNADKANALYLRQTCVEFVRNLLNNKETLTDEEMDSFDNKFMKDVFAYNGIN